MFKDVEKRPAEIKLLTAPNVRSWDLNRLFYLVPKSLEESTEVGVLRGKWAIFYAHFLL